MQDVTIYHNIAEDALGRHVAWNDGYTPGHPLVPVAQYTHPSDSVAVVLLDAFDTFNVGTDARAERYRDAGNRTLSVGDVVQVGDQWRACARFGWDEIEAPAWLARSASTYGTTSIHKED